VTLSFAIAQVESVGGEESPFVAVSVGDSESDSVAATSEGRLEEFNAIGKAIVGAVSRWLHCFGGSQLFHGLRKLVLEVRGEWCRWVEVALCEREPVVGATMGAGGEFVRENLCERPTLLLGIVFPIFNPLSRACRV